MISIGEKYVYKMNGVCTLSAEESHDGAPFYKLIPMTDPTLTIFVPADRAPLRSPMTGAQAKALLDSVENMENVWVDDSRTRRKKIDSIMSEGGIFELTAMVKSLYGKKQERRRAGKSMYSYEDTVLRNAMKSVCGELAYSLGLSGQEAVSLLEQKME